MSIKHDLAAMAAILRHQDALDRHRAELEAAAREAFDAETGPAVRAEVQARVRRVLRDPGVRVVWPEDLATLADADVVRAALWPAAEETKP